MKGAAPSSTIPGIMSDAPHTMEHEQISSLIEEMEARILTIRDSL